MNDRERIEQLIARNDFQTAENVMRKANLPPEVCRELSEKIAGRKKQRELDSVRKRRKERLFRRLQKFNFRTWKVFLAVFLVLGGIASAYYLAADLFGENAFGGLLARLRLPMDIFGLLALADMVVWWGLIALAVRRRDRSSMDGDAFLVWTVLFSLVLFCFLLKYIF